MEFHGVSWSLHGAPLSSMEFDGVPKEFHGLPWNSMESPRRSMEFYEVSMEPHGHFMEIGNRCYMNIHLSYY